MKSWLKFFGLSFFSDKIAKEARTRGVLNCVLGFVLALVFIFCGALAANTVPFYSHYKNAADFKSFLYAFSDETQLSLNSGLVSSENIINTYKNESDAQKYVKNGYNLVIDTRASTALDDFEAYCLSKDGKTEISYEQYLQLTEEEKKGYDFKIRYTDRELILTEELVAGYEYYLSATEDEDIKKQFNELADKKNDVAAETYNKSVYSLYLSAYYPAIISYERAGEVPLLRSFYYSEYLSKSETVKSIFIFDDMLFGLFNTDGGMEVAFYGFFEKLANRTITAENADKFIKDTFSSSVSLSANVYLMNIFRLIPFIALIPVILALVAKLVFTFIKDEKYKKYTTCLKIEFSYLAVGALITALIVFICGFFVSGVMLSLLPLIAFAAVLAVRTAVLLIGENINFKKTPAAPAEGETDGGTDAQISAQTDGN